MEGNVEERNSRDGRKKGKNMIRQKIRKRASRER